MCILNSSTKDTFSNIGGNYDKTIANCLIFGDNGDCIKCKLGF